MVYTLCSRVGQHTQRAANYTARSNIGARPKFLLTPTFEARPDREALATTVETWGVT